MTLTKINSPRVNGKGLQKAVVFGYIVIPAIQGQGFLNDFMVTAFEDEYPNADLFKA